MMKTKTTSNNALSLLSRSFSLSFSPTFSLSLSLPHCWCIRYVLANSFLQEIRFFFCYELKPLSPFLVCLFPATTQKVLSVHSCLPNNIANAYYAVQFSRLDCFYGVIRFIRNGLFLPILPCLKFMATHKHVDSV